MTTREQSASVFSRRNTLLAAGALALSVPLARIPAGALAQDATPTVEGGAEIEGAPGVWAEVFSGVPSDRAPGQTVYLARFTFFPGSEIFSHGHPGSTSISVDSGVIGWTLAEGTAHVIRGAALGETGPAEEISEPGQNVVLNPGDAMYYEEDVVHTSRCEGDEAAIVLAALLLTEGEPLVI